MNKKILLALLVIGILVAAVGAVAYDQFYHSHSVTVPPPIAEYVDGVYYENETQIDWGTLNPGSYYINYTIYNNTTYSLTATLLTHNLPSGWTLIWSNSTVPDLSGAIIASYTSLEGNLTLTIPLGASGLYTWGHYLRIEEATS